MTKGVRQYFRGHRLEAAALGLTIAASAQVAKDLPKLLEYLKDADMVIGTCTT